VLWRSRTSNGTLQGLPVLAAAGALNSAAAQPSADQADPKAMGLTGPEGSGAGERIRPNGGPFSTWSENVLNPSFTQIGVAVASAANGMSYWVMVLSG
jgi:uncharacterized protein YkwD|tara:strand:- start:639 stop:932 length:294 start_codon:yes stop_codon:yes gene_type:complete